MGATRRLSLKTHDFVSHRASECSDRVWEGGLCFLSLFFLFLIIVFFSTTE